MFRNNHRALIWLFLLTGFFAYSFTYKNNGAINKLPEVMQVDQLGNVYLAMSSGDLHKYTFDGDSLTTQNFKRYGKLSNLDVSNPFELYLFYSDLNRVVFLDNQLSERGSVELEDADLENVSTVGRSWDNGLWVYDLATTKLIKYNKQLEKATETPQSFTYTNAVLNPIQIIDKQTEIYLCDSSEGVFVFDNFGMFIKRLAVQSKRVAVQNKHLVYSSDSGIYAMHLKTFANKKISGQKGQVSFSLAQDRIALVDSNKVVTRYMK